MAKKKIMVVDDEPDIRETVKTVLENEGYEIIEAKNADQCLERLKSVKPDLILMDVMMPGTKPKEAIKEIEGIKIAYLTVVRTSEAEREKLLESEKVVDYIQKPFDVDDLVKRVKDILEK